MSLLSNSANVAYAGRYPTDKIVNVFTGSFSVSAATVVAGYLYRTAIPHGYTRPVFCKLKWSTDNTNWVDGGFSYRSGDTNKYPSIAYSDSSNVYILTGVPSGTIYYQVICFWIDNYDNTFPAISPYSAPNKNTIFDSRVNYQKIYQQDTSIFTGTGSTNTITHDLGYMPNTRVFFEAFSGQVWPAIAGGLSDYFLYDPTNQAELEYRISNTSLSLIYTGRASTGTRKAWYRIYLDK